MVKHTHTNEELTTIYGPNYDLKRGSRVKIIAGFYAGYIGILVDRKMLQEANHETKTLIVYTEYLVSIDSLAETVAVLSDEVQIYDNK